MLLPAPMAALPSCWGRWQWKPRASEAPRRNGGFWTTLRCVDVGVKEDGRRGVDGAQRAEDIGVLPARLGRRCDVPVRRARRVQVHRPEGGDAESVVAARLQPRCGGRRGGAARVSGVVRQRSRGWSLTLARRHPSQGGGGRCVWQRPGSLRTAALADRLSRAGGLELGALDDVSRVVVRDGHDERGATALAGRVHGGHRRRPVAPDLRNHFRSGRKRGPTLNMAQRVSCAFR